MELTLLEQTEKVAAVASCLALYRGADITKHAELFHQHNWRVRIVWPHLSEFVSNVEKELNKRMEKI